MDYKDTKVKVLGGFKIDSLNKEYVLCSYENDESLIIICEIAKDDYGNSILVDIPEEEEDFVLMTYKTLKQELLRETNE